MKSQYAARGLIALTITWSCVFHDRPTLARSLTPIDGLAANSAGVEINSDGMVGMALSYSHRFHPALLARDLLLHAELSTPVLLAPQHDSMRARVGTSAILLMRGHAALSGGLFASLTTAENDLGSFIGLGGEAALVPSLRFHSWHVGLLLGIRHEFATHIHNSAYVKQTFSDRHPGNPADDASGPVDGWYRGNATRYLVGLEGAVVIGHALTIEGGAGLLLTDQPFGIFSEGMIGMLPFYGQIGIAYHF